MAVEIKSGAGTDLATVEPASKSIRVTNYSSAGIEGIQSLPIELTISPVNTEDDDLISSIDVAQYKFASIQLTGTWVGTVSFQGSNDNGTFYPILASDPSGGNATGESSTTTNRLIKIPTIYKYLRVRLTSYTSGTVNGVAYGHRDENSSGLISSIGPVTIADGPIETIHKVITSATTNEAVIKASAGRLRTFSLVNGTTTVRFVHLYNQSTSPTVGTDVPFVTVTIPPNAESGFRPPQGGLIFSDGIAFSMTMGAADTDATPDAVAAAVTGFIGFT